MEQRKPPAAGKGRALGSRNKVTVILKEAILGAFSDVGGREYLAKQARENPTAFMTLLGKVLPADLNVSTPNGPIAYAVTPERAKSMVEWTQAVTLPSQAIREE
jgi:hypothetical protein